MRKQSSCVFFFYKYFVKNPSWSDLIWVISPTSIMSFTPYLTASDTFSCSASVFSKQRKQIYCISLMWYVGLIWVMLWRLLQYLFDSALFCCSVHSNHLEIPKSKPWIILFISKTVFEGCGYNVCCFILLWVKMCFCKGSKKWKINEKGNIVKLNLWILWTLEP